MRRVNFLVVWLIIYILIYLFPALSIFRPPPAKYISFDCHASKPNIIFLIIKFICLYINLCANILDTETPEGDKTFTYGHQYSSQYECQRNGIKYSNRFILRC